MHAHLTASARVLWTLAALLSGAAASGLALATTSLQQLTQIADCRQALASPFVANGTALNPERIQLVNWNIQKGQDRSWADDLNTIAGDADLITLQEASPGLTPITQLSRHYDLAFAEGYRRTGVLTLAASSYDRQCALLTYEPWIGTPKATLITRYAIADRTETLLVANLHGVNFSIGAEALAAQLSEINELISVHAGPAIVTGDFNTWRAGRFQLLSDAMNAGGMKAVTFQPDLRTRVFFHPLDHIYTRGLAVLSASSLAVASSDHNPLWASFQVESDAAGPATVTTE